MRTSTAKKSMSLVDLAYQHLYRQIADHKIKPGSKLIISRLAADFGTSTIPIREALSRLLLTRFVTFEPNRGYHVAQPPTLEQIEQLFQARLVLESGAIDIGHKFLTNETSDKLEKINFNLSATNVGTNFEEMKDFTTLDQEFHTILIELSNNAYICDSYTRLAYHHQTYRNNFGRGIPDKAQIVREHNQIISALRSGSPTEARAALVAHITGGFDRLTRPLASGQHDLVKGL